MHGSPAAALARSDALPNLPLPSSLASSIAVTSDVTIEQGEVVLPTIECATKVDQLREVWTSISRPTPKSDRPRPDLNLTEPASSNAPPILNSDARDLKIAELQKQLQELERRTKPTRTSPEGSHHSGIDFIKPHIELKKTIIKPTAEIICPPGFGATRALRVRDA